MKRQVAEFWMERVSLHRQGVMGSRFWNRNTRVLVSGIRDTIGASHNRKGVRGSGIQMLEKQHLADRVSRQLCFTKRNWSVRQTSSGFRPPAAGNGKREAALLLFVY
jgi:hypothetical protein